jgi:hypothetical protein
MYNFNYDAVVPASSTDSQEHLEVRGHTMVGITPTMCSFNSFVSIDFPIFPGVDVKALANEFALPCGYYVEYIWSGSDAVTFNINTNSAIKGSVSVVMMFFALSLFNF